MDIIDAGLEYWWRWFCSQQAWTKVPGHSQSLSETITVTYIADFASGNPWHQWKGAFSNVKKS
ncbi:hypothetical protein [Devosia sp. 1635]|uniref:hypothetical protein n=1 Tax=Devosia sp. 1635 TaxID=2726066 RepID=UPI001565F105|nr:hypothetical protein [Devosia sp. 1635]